MALEIERRFLVNMTKVPDLDKFPKKVIVQGYLNEPGGEAVIRSRIVKENGTEQGFLTIKGRVAEGINREFEYKIPYSDALELINSSEGRIVSKTRYLIPTGKHTVELDVFAGKLDGMVIAEIEIDDINEAIELPDFLSAEITATRGMSNFAMACYPAPTLKLYETLVRG